jgi:hypothetical protein
MLTDPMFNLCENSACHRSTSSISALVCRKGVWPNLGSSAIDTSLTVTVPDMRPSFRLPIFTVRPSDFVNADSISGRNSSALKRNGRASAQTSSTAATPRMM